MTLPTVPLTDWSRRYGLDDLEQLLDPTPPAPAPSTTKARSLPYIGPERPGDAFNARHTGGEILTRLGFTLARRDRNGDEHYVRPGKDRRQGTSATVYGDDGHTTIWSDTCAAVWRALDTRRPYDPFGLYAATSHDGDWRAATTELARQGYGEPRQPDDLSWAVPAPFVVPGGNDEMGEEEGDAIWPAPEPFEPKLSSGPLFPLDVLPDWIANRVSDVSREVSVPVDYAAIAALGTLSAVAMNRVTLNLSERRQDLPLNLWLAAAGESGVSKSYPFEQLTAPLWQFIDDLEAAGAQERSEREAALTIAEKRLKELEQRPQSSPEAPTVAMLGEARLAIEEARATIPADPHFIVDDATPEAVTEHYRDCGEIAAIFDDEGSVIDMMAGQYAKDTAAVTPYISGYDRTPINVRRVGRGRVTVRRPSLTVCVMTQPVVLAKLGQHSYLAGKGVVPRFLLANPPDTRGWRDYDNQLRPYDPSSKRVYESTLLDLARRLGRSGHHLRVRASAEAFERWIEWNKENEPRLRRGGDLRRMVAWYEKIRTATFRTAALLHLADHPNDHVEEIDVETFERAFRLSEYWVAHAKVLMDAWVDRQIKDEAGIGPRGKSLVEWFIETGADEVTLAEVRTRMHDSYGLSKAEIIPIVEFLAEGGWVRVPDDFAIRAKSKRPLTITIHPDAATYLYAVDDERPDIGVWDDAPDSPDSSDESENRGNRGNISEKNRGNRRVGDRYFSRTTTTYPQSDLGAVDADELRGRPQLSDSPDSQGHPRFPSPPQPVVETGEPAECARCAHIDAEAIPERHVCADCGTVTEPAPVATPVDPADLVPPVDPAPASDGGSWLWD